MSTPSDCAKRVSPCETWLLVLSGNADAGSFKVSQGDTLFAQSDGVDIHAGAIGVVGLVAYKGGGGTIPHLLQRITRRHRSMPGGSNEIRVPTSPTQAKAAP